MFSNYKISFEWCVELPTETQSRESPAFMLNSNEWLFRFVKEEDLRHCGFTLLECYTVCLELKSKRKDLKSWFGKIQVGFKNEKTFSLGKGQFEVSEDCEVWRIWDCDLQSKLRTSESGECLKFLFEFQNVNEPLSKLSKETDDKSAQTASYMDTCVMLDGVSTDFSKLFLEGPHHDVTFICGDETIKAHKNVLCCRSDVFASMLQTDMMEGKTSEVKIQDMEAAIFRQFLKCLYTGVLPDLTVDVASQFYEAADKYAVDALKKQCASFLVQTLSPANACKILIMSDRHSDSDFKNIVVEYMIMKKIPFVGEKWTDFCKDNPSLATEVLNLFCQHLDSKLKLVTEDLALNLLRI